MYYSHTLRNTTNHSPSQQLKCKQNKQATHSHTHLYTVMYEPEMQRDIHTNKHKQNNRKYPHRIFTTITTWSTLNIHLCIQLTYGAKIIW